MKMRSCVILVAFVLFSTQLLRAQVNFSPKVGVNVSGLDMQLEDYNASVRTGWHAGLDMRIGEGVIFLNPGVQYNSNTARLVEEIDQDTRIDFANETTIQSIKAPINLGIRITGDNGLLGVYLKGGIVPTYVLDVKEVDGYGFSKDDLTPVSWGANMGIGIDFLVFTADLSYENGMTDFFIDKEGKNNMLSLSVGLKF